MTKKIPVSSDGITLLLIRDRTAVYGRYALCPEAVIISTA